MDENNQEERDHFHVKPFDVDILVGLLKQKLSHFGHVLIS